MTKAYFELLNGLSEVRGRYETDYFNGVLGCATPETEARPIVTLSGLLDTTASASLSVANTTSEPTLISYVTTDIRRVDGQGPAFHPAIIITPEHLELKPDEEGEVTLSLPLHSGQYDPGALYIGALYISGGNAFGAEVQLRITALSRQSPAPPSHAAGA